LNRFARRTAIVILSVAAAAGVQFAAAAPASASTGQTSTESQVITLVNQQRAKVGCVALRYDVRLRTAAYNHSVDMAAHNYFDHTGSDGSTFVTRVQAAGYSAALGENIAWGWRTPADVMNAWMNSAPHKANILNCAARAIGVGMAKKADGTPYWTQEFGTV
jgi:uncharacterized protein YkwD